MSMPLKMSVVPLLLMLTACMSATPNLHLVDGETRMTLTQSAPISRGADISPDGRYLLTGGMGNFTYWDISRGALLRRYSTELPQIMGTMLTTAIVPVAFSGQGRHAISGGAEVKLWDLASGQVLRTLATDPANSIGVSADGSTVLTCEESEWAFKEDKLTTHEVDTGRTTTEWNAANSAGLIALSPDGRYALSSGGGGRKSTAADRGTIHLWEVASGARLMTLAGTGGNQGLGSAVLALAFSPDGRQALSGGTDGSLRLWELAAGRERLAIAAHTGWVGTKAVAFSPDGRGLLSVGGSDGLARLWDRATGALLREFPVSDDRFVALRRFGGLVSGWVAFTPDSQRIIYMGSDASFRIFAAATGEEIATLIAFDDGEWLVVTPEGYYNGSEQGARHLQVNYAGRDYRVDQFYDVFYRPDIVAAKLSGEEIGGLVSLTMKEASQSPPPTVAFANLPSRTEQATIKACYSARSNGGGIGEVRLFHNGKLVASDGFYRELAQAPAEELPLAALDSRAIYREMRGIRLREISPAAGAATVQVKGESFQECREVDLIPGENELGVTAFNRANTIQGALHTARLTAKIAGTEPRLYIVAIGIDQYRDDSVNLKFAGKDAREMAQKLAVAAETLYPPRNISQTLLLDGEATKARINEQLSRLATTIKPGDSFVLFVAGHGVLLQNQYYMLTHDYAGAVNEASLISSNELIEMSKKIKALSQLLIFDTCHAGGVDAIVSGLYDARMSVLARKMGLHLYASANSREAALDGYQGNGLFTSALLAGLTNRPDADRNRDGEISLVELGAFAKQQTQATATTLGRPQTPLIINFGSDSPVYRLR